MSNNYDIDKKLQSMGERLIATNHPHLKSANVAYLMKTQEGESKPPKGPKRAGKAVKIASARLVPAVYRELCPYDFLIVVDQKQWDWLTLEQHDAIMDHELCHCRRDDDGWYLRDHDVEDFREIIERHGFYRKGLEDFCNARQGSLPFDRKSEVHAVQ